MTGSYLGNPNLRGPGVHNDQWTKAQLQEWYKCKQDPIYFTRNYIKIVHVDLGLIPFDLYGFQEDLIQTMNQNRFVICKIPRQSGKSQTTIAYLLWYILFHRDVSVAILANKGDTAREMLYRLQQAYEYLPKWLQQGVVTWNKGSIELENGSRMLAAATSSSAIRGRTFNIIFLDEFAHIGNNLAEEFFMSVYPTISSGSTTKVFIVSTPKGMNMFYKFWKDATEKRSSYIPVEVTWDQVPQYVDGKPVKRDEKWKQEQIKNTSAEQFAQEFECDFIGSSDTLITGAKLRAMVHETPMYSQNGLTVFENPKDGHRYVMCVDTAQGMQLDYSALTVVDVSTVPYKLVAKYRSNMISPMLFPNVVWDIGRRYNNAYVLVAIDDGSGLQCVEILHHDLEYEHIFAVATKGRAGQKLSAGYGKNVQFGVKMTTPVQRVGCANLKSLIELDKLLIHDFDVISELSTFVQNGKKFEADEGYHDDLVDTLVIFGWLVQQKYFKEMIESDLRARLREEQAEQLMHDMTPFGVWDHGQPIYDEELLSDGSGDIWTPVEQLPPGYNY